MDNTKIVVIEFRLPKSGMLCLLSFMFLAWHPGFLGSETLTLTTYYPAPYGSYVSLLTTSQTLLARDAGTVGIGTRGVAPDATKKLHIVGDTRMDGGLRYTRSVPNIGDTLTASNTSGDVIWQNHSGLNCQWVFYAANSATPCPVPAGWTGGMDVLAAREGVRLRSLWVPPNGGEMLCCRIAF